MVAKKFAKILERKISKFMLRDVRYKKSKKLQKEQMVAKKLAKI